MYQITYYRDIAMATRLSDMDILPDRAVESGAYPAPAPHDGVAVARRHDGKLLYGYESEWHAGAPTAALTYERKRAAEARAAACGLLPRTETGETWELSGAGPQFVHLRHLRSEHVSGRTWRAPQGAVDIRWDDLATAAETSDWYGEVLRRARIAFYRPF